VLSHFGAAWSVWPIPSREPGFTQWDSWQNSPEAPSQPAKGWPTRRSRPSASNFVVCNAFGLQTGEHPTVAPRQGAVVSAQRTEGNFAGLAAFAMRDANDHALFVDVLGTELAEFGAAPAGVIQSHQDGAVAEIGGQRR
jgi:hypothetical protein